MSILSRIVKLEEQSRDESAAVHRVEKKHPMDLDGMQKMICELFTFEQVAGMNEELKKWLKT